MLENRVGGQRGPQLARVGNGGGCGRLVLVGSRRSDGQQPVQRGCTHVESEVCEGEGCAVSFLLSMLLSLSSLPADLTPPPAGLRHCSVRTAGRAMQCVRVTAAALYYVEHGRSGGGTTTRHESNAA